jgi:hypothetical protein
MKKLNENEEEPWCYYGSIKVTFSSGKPTFGTCCQIDPYTIITSAHVFDESEELERENTNISKSFKNLTELVSNINNIHYRSGNYDVTLQKSFLFIPEYYFHRNNNIKHMNDFAILRLPKPKFKSNQGKNFIEITDFKKLQSLSKLAHHCLGNTVDIRFFGFPLLKKCIISSEELHEDGFRKNLLGNISSMVVDQSYEFILNKNSNSEGGHSGCPYILIIDDKFYSIAVHKAYSIYRDANVGLLFNEKIIILFNRYKEL